MQMYKKINKLHEIGTSKEGGDITSTSSFACCIWLNGRKKTVCAPV